MKGTDLRWHHGRPRDGVGVGADHVGDGIHRRMEHGPRCRRGVSEKETQRMLRRWRKEGYLGGELGRSRGKSRPFPSEMNKEG